MRQLASPLLIIAVLGAVSCRRLAAYPSAPPADSGSPIDRGADLPAPIPDLPPSPKWSAIDLLFVIDNSASMDAKQARLALGLPQLIGALRRVELGPDGSGKPCHDKDGSGCNIPDLHLGVVTTDLGAGNFSLPACEVAGGDGGELQSRARTGCTTLPTDPWIAYEASTQTSNVPTGAAHHIDRVEEAFSCIARVGTTGCSFEQPLEAARRALDPNLHVNPGFLRAEAVLVVVFVTDEDDCSAEKPALFDPSKVALTDPLGPLTSFRCFEFGISCDTNDRLTIGTRSSCTPAHDWLYAIDDYVTFYETLKPAGHVVLASIAGPPTPVVVAKEGGNPTVQPSCSSSGGSATPAIRIKALVDRFGGLTGSICDSDYGPLMQQIGARALP